jgi:hypothetical protein
MLGNSDMENAQKIAIFLTNSSGKYYCDRSLSELVGVKPVTQVNQITGSLSLREDFHRIKETCAHCGKRRKCTAFIGPQTQSRESYEPAQSSSRQALDPRDPVDAESVRKSRM